MDILNYDCLYNISEFLTLNDIYHLAITCQSTSDLLIDEKIWKKWTKITFGEVEKEDIKEEYATWKTTCMTFTQLRKDTLDYLDKRDNKKGSKVKNLVVGQYKTLLFRDNNKAMVIPICFRSFRKPNTIGLPMVIYPRNGDVIIDLDRVGYRNEGLTIWDEDKMKRTGLCSVIDDYGSVPFTLSWPTYPITYYTDIIAHNNLSETQKLILENLVFRIKSVQKAKTNKYILLNAPNKNLQKIIEVIPGMKSPTVMPLATEGWSSVHSVLSEEQFWEIIDQLKELGAQGILVVPIEKMIIENKLLFNLITA